MTIYVKKNKERDREREGGMFKEIFQDDTKNNEIQLSHFASNLLGL